MDRKSARRSKLTGLAVQEKSWDLQALRDRQRLAAEQFETAATAASELAREIEDTQGQLSATLNGERPMDLDSIQATRAWIADRSSLHKQYVAELRRAAHQASQAEIQVRHAALTVRALERVKDRADREVRKSVVLRTQELDIELWLQRALHGEEDD